MSRSRTASFFGHPPGLAILFFAEAWERFSFYGLRALLVFYLIKHLGFSQPDASQIYGTYTAAVYFTPLIGGYIADRWLGPRRAVVIGAVIMAAGHFLMAFEPMVFPALALVAIGNGAFKPSISAQVGRLYARDDPRRDGGYSLFYMGINLGGLIAPLICGTAGALYGWHWGFALAGLGMLAATAIYVFGQPLILEAEQEAHSVAPPGPTSAGGARRSVMGLLVLALVAVFFWTAVEQMGNTVALWIDSDVDRTLAVGTQTFEIPTVWFQSLNPLLVIALTPLLATAWTRGVKPGRHDSSLSKMIVGCLLAALAYAPLAVAAAAGVTGDLSLLLAVLFFVPLTLGELCLSPMGQSMFSRRAPVRYATLMMGAWFFAHTIGNYVAGYLGGFWSVMPKAAFFAMVGAIPLSCGLTLVVFRTGLERLFDTSLPPTPPRH
ncbi:peptide MFS transporter [Phenylobacterium sp.]|uniref:peptide MFS transporter n=1 Tax=Phenylobacterium sp. TaxID=1871053 RepID=UPI0025DD683C|nr:peptide MFS transporter [Phenylobacterium sp.]